MRSQLSPSRASATKPGGRNGLAGTGSGPLHQDVDRPLSRPPARSQTTGPRQGRSASLRGGRSQAGRERHATTAIPRESAASAVTDQAARQALPPSGPVAADGPEQPTLGVANLQQRIGGALSDDF